MRSYKEFLIAPLVRGVSKQFSPWLTPDEAFTELNNIYSQNGVLKKRGGTTLFGQLGRVISEETSPAFVNVAGNNYTKNMAQRPVIPHSLKVYEVGGNTQEAWDDGDGGFTGDATGSVDYTATPAAIDITFAAAVTGTLKADYHYSDTGTDRVVRGIQLFNKDVGAEELLAMDKRRLSTWNTTQTYFDNIASGTAVAGEELVATGHGTGPGPYAGTISNKPVVPYTVSVYDSVASPAQILYDNGNGSFVETQEGVWAGTGKGSINYTTGAITGLIFSDDILDTSPIHVDYRHTATPVYDNWNSSNLVWYRSWIDLLWLMDSSSHIHVYNETNVIDITPRMVLDAAGANFLLSAKCMVLLKGRPIFLNTTETDGDHTNRARWPAAGNSLTVDAWRDDISGYGDYNDATTNDEIITAVELKDRIVVFFENDIGFLVYTGNPDLPYSWQMLNSDFQIDSTFGIWKFKEMVTAVGKFEMIASDGNSAARANEKIPDFTLEIDYDNIDKCYGHIIPSRKLAWLAYPTKDPSLGYPNKVLVYNYEDNIISTFDFIDIDGSPLPVRCLSDFSNQKDTTYADLNSATFWPDVKTIIDARGTNAYFSDYKGKTYKELAHQKGEQIVLAGGNDGYVYHVDDDGIDTDNGTGYNFNIVTKKYNPYNQLGTGVSLGYVDFLVTVNADCQIEVKFYLGFDDKPTGTLAKTFVCNGTGHKVWKRAYCNASAPVISYSISHPDGKGLKEYSFELHAHKPAFKSGGNLI